MRGGLDASGQLVGAGLRRPRRRSQPSRLQRARHGAGRPAHRAAQDDPGARPGLVAVGHVRRAASPADDARREPAAGVGDAAAHRQPARSRRAAGDLRVGVVHRRAGGGGQGRPGGVPAAALHRVDRGRQRFQARPVDRGARCHAEGLRVGRAPVAEGPRLRRRSSPAAASPTPIAARPWPRRSSRSRSTGAPDTCGPSASSVPTTAAWSSTPRRCAARSSAGCCTRSAGRCTRRCGSTPRRSPAWTG